MNVEKKNSEYINDFIGLFQKAWGGYHAAHAQEANADKETQDILHWYEFCGLEASEEELIKMGRALSQVRRYRRKAKDEAVVLAPAVKWIEKNGAVRENAKQLLEEVRKAEKSTENRCYTNRTDIVVETLGRKHEI